MVDKKRYGHVNYFSHFKKIILKIPFFLKKTYSSQPAPTRVLTGDYGSVPPSHSTTASLTIANVSQGGLPISRDGSRVVASVSCHEPYTHTSTIYQMELSRASFVDNLPNIPAAEVEDSSPRSRRNAASSVARCSGVNGVWMR